MARLLFEEQAVRTRRGSLSTGIEYVVYTDAAGTVLADISATIGGAATSTATVVAATSTVISADIAGVGPASLKFYGPDNVDNLYLRCPADPDLGVQEIEADPDKRLDTLEAAGGGGIHPDLAAHDSLGLATDTELTTHAADTTAVHGIADTSVLATDAEVASAVSTHEGLADPHTGYVTDAGLASHEADTTSVHGITDTTVLATSSSVTSAVSTHAGLADPHTGYVLESLYDAKGDLLAASAADTPAKLTAGANDTVLTADSSTGTGLKWATPAVVTHPNLATHDALGLATDAELSTHAGAADPHTGYVLESTVATVDAGAPSGGDDLAALQAKVDALAEGGILQFRPGQVYQVSAPLQLKKNRTYQGTHAPRWMYRGGSPAQIRPTAGFSGAAVLRVGDELAGGTIDNDGGRIRDLAVDGHSIGSGVHGIQFEGLVRDWEVEHVDCSQVTGSGFRTTNTANGYPRGLRLARCSSYSADDKGFSFNNLTDSHLEDLLAVSCSSFGFLFDSPGESKLVASRALFNGSDGLHIQGAATVGGMQVIGFSTDRNLSYGVKVNATGNQPIVFSNLLTRRDGKTNTGDLAGVGIVGTAGNLVCPVRISGLVQTVGVDDDASGAETPKHGVRVEYASEAHVEGALWGVTTALFDNGNNTRLTVGVATTGKTGTRTSPTTSDIGATIAHPDLAAHDTLGLVTDAILASHEADTTAIHGITDTSVLATATSVATAVSNHEADTTGVHGIPDASVLATTSGVTSAVSTHAGLADPHTGYVLESLLDAKGDIVAASADNTPAKLTAGANDTVLTADSSTGTGLKWAATGVAAHEADTTSIHGITDTAQVALRNAANTFTVDQRIDAHLGIGVASASGDLHVLSAGQAAYLKSTGTQNTHVLTCYQAQSAAGSDNAVAGNFTSDNPEGSCVYIAGQATQRGVLKISHAKPAGADTTASALAIDMTGSGTACQGIALITTDVTTGNLLLLRNNGVDDFVVKGTGKVAIRVPIATTPTGALMIGQGDDSTVGLAIQANSASAQQMVLLKDSTGAAKFEVSAAGNMTARATALFTGSVQMGSASSSFGGGTLVIGIHNAGTVPTTDPTAGGILYAENGALKWRGSAGTVTVLGIA